MKQTIKIVAVLIGGLGIVSPSFAETTGFDRSDERYSRSTRPPIPPPEVDLYVPPVYDRPITDEDGPRIPVRLFDVTFLTNDSPVTAFEQEAEALAELLRREALGLDQIDNYNFTQDEIDLVRGIFNDAATDFRSAEDRAAEIKVLLGDLRYGRFLRSGLTIGQMQQISNRVTNLLRSKGFFLAQAILPAQDVEDAVVTMMVVEGTLSGINVEGESYYREPILRRPFESLMGQVVTKEEIEGGLLSLNDFPGLSALGVFAKGDSVGATILRVGVQREDPLDFEAHYDNHGSESTGEQRLRFKTSWNNPLRIGDELDLTVLGTFDPDNSVYGSIDYTAPIFNHGSQFGFSYSLNNFDIAGEVAVLELSGEAQIGSVFYERTLKRSRNYNAYLNFELASKVATTLLKDDVFSKDRLTAVSVDFKYDFIDTKFNGLNQGSVSLSKGVPRAFNAAEKDAQVGFGNVSRPNAGGAFTRWNADFTRLQSFGRFTSGIFRVAGQFTNDVLLPIEEYALGGPGNVRAYPSAEFLVDKAIFASVELSRGAPFFEEKPFFNTGLSWGQVFQTSIFFDWTDGAVNANPISQNSTSVELHGAGIGLQFQLPGSIYSKLNVATHTSSDQKPSNDRDVQVYFEVDYSF